MYLTKDFKLNTAHHLNKIFPNSKLMKLGSNKKVKTFLEKKFREKILMQNFEIFAKPNQTGRKVPFHQDNFYWNIKNNKAANLWIALNKLNKSNGGLVYLKGSHKLGLKKHTKIKYAGHFPRNQKKYIRENKTKKNNS